MAEDAADPLDLAAGEQMEALSMRIATAQVLDPRADVLLDEARACADRTVEALGAGDTRAAYESATLGLGVLRAGEVIQGLSFD